MADPLITRDDLVAVEEHAFTTAVAQAKNGEAIGPLTAHVLTLTLARLLGEHDWVAEAKAS